MTTDEKKEFKTTALRCVGCSIAPAELVFDGKPYCSDNCSLHENAKRRSAEINGDISERRGGSPVTVQRAEALLLFLRGLKPVKRVDFDGTATVEEEICPHCWRFPYPTHRDGKYVGYCQACHWWSDR